MSRPGLTNLILRWRSMVDDRNETIWNNEQAQEMLDAYRLNISALPLNPVVRHSGGVTAYLQYQSEYRNLEEYTDGDTTAFRLYDSSGASPLVSLYAFDYINGLLTFTTDQAGRTYYLDGRAFDLNRAAAQAWEERAGLSSGLADIRNSSNASKSQSQIFDHCMKMAAHYRSKGGLIQARVIRA